MSLKRKLKRIHKENQSDVSNQHLPEALILLSQWDLYQPVTMDFYNLFSREAWGLACCYKGVYQIITKDLVDFLGYLIKGKTAMEIGCGAGTLGKSLNIPLIDRKVQEQKEAKAYYQVHEQAGVPTKIPYPPDVIEMTANAAFRQYHPQWVIGSWITQKLVKGKIGMIYGPMEEEFVEKASYVHVGTGHLDIHTRKRINKMPHYIIEADWLVNRSVNDKPSQMRIWTKDELDFDAFPEHLEFDYYHSTQ